MEATQGRSAALPQTNLKRTTMGSNTMTYPNRGLEQGLVQGVDAQTLLREGAPGSHEEFDRLVRTIWRLRQDDGCPWDRVQTHESITKHMVEEAYEAVEAIAAGDVAHMREELGDVLEQVLLHAQIAADSDEFSIDDVCRELNEKLIRRHPHVFGSEEDAASADDALYRWEEVKRKERAARGEAEAERGLLDSVPITLPALMQAQKISQRAVKVGFEWDTVDDIWQQVADERAEFLREERGSDAAALEFGDLLFSLVNVARREGIDAEEALAASNRKFRRRWAAMEALARKEGCALEDLSTAAQNELWDRVKTQEHEQTQGGGTDD